MKLITEVTSKDHIESALNSNISEVIIGSLELSKNSILSCESTIELIRFAKSKKLKVSLLWDILMSGEEFFRSLKIFTQIVEKTDLDAIRLQDVGALNYIIESTNLKVQLLLEHRNHNIVGIKKYIEIIDSQLDRLILSPELSYKELERMNTELNVDTEILGIGPILLFYTPRKLLNGFEASNGRKSVLGKSEESPHNGFPIIENIHGTLMYSIKDQFILDEFEYLKKSGTKFLRLDLIASNQISQLEHYSKAFYKEDRLALQKLIEKYPKKTFKGYFRTNKSDTLFKKLKNQKVSKDDSTYLGEVKDIIKEKLIGVILDGPSKITKGEALKLVTPEGKEKSFTLKELYNSSLNKLEEIDSGELVYIPYLGGVSPGTVLLRNH